MPLVSRSKDNQYLIFSFPFLLLYTADATHLMSVNCHPAGLIQQYPCNITIARGNSLEQASSILGKLRWIAVLERRNRIDDLA